MGSKRGQSYSTTLRLSPRIVSRVAFTADRLKTLYPFVNYNRLPSYQALYITIDRDIDIDIEHTDSSKPYQHRITQSKCKDS